jgi:UDP-N-acetylglucosamine 2-epimerase (non-hydrolysing)
MQKLKVTTILGTRPEIIRLAEISKKFDKHFDHRIVHTGQNSALNLSDIFFEDLGLRNPDVNFGISATNVGNFFGEYAEHMHKSK